MIDKTPPFTRERIKDYPSDGAREFVFVSQPMWENFVDSVYDRGLYIFPIPKSGDDGAIQAFATGVFL